MPLACEPIEIAGLNRMWRQLAIDGIEKDPAWRGGDYSTEPLTGLRAAENLLFVAGSAPLYYQLQYSTRPRRAPMPRSGSRAASESWTPTTHLPAGCVAELQSMAAAGADQGAADVDQFGRRFHQSAQFAVPAEALKRMPTARFRLIPETAETHGHGTHTWAKFWKADLIALLARSEPNRMPRRG